MPDFPYVINGVSEEDTAVLIFAAMAHFDTQTLLMCRSVSVNWRHAIDSFTKLWSRMSLAKAVKENRMDICELIILNADNKNPKDADGWTPLHEAAKRGYANIVRLIMDNVVIKNPHGKRDLTPLHEAARGGHIEICRLIIEAVDEKSPRDQEGYSPLHLAARKGYTDICRLLIDATNDSNPVNEVNACMIQ